MAGASLPAVKGEVGGWPISPISFTSFMSLKDKTDFALIRDINLGSHDAFTELHSRHNSNIKKQLSSLHHSYDVDDLVQDCWMHIIKKLPSFRFEAAFSTWAYRIVQNLFLMSLRKNKHIHKFISMEDEVLDGVKLSGCFKICSHRNHVHAKVDLERILPKLPRGYRTVLVKYAYEGLHHHEVAEKLGSSVGNVKSQFHKAKRAAKRLLGE